MEGKTSLDVQIVSASRSSQTLGEIPVTAYVVTHEEIVRNGYTTLVDVLKSVPGMRVSKPGSGPDGEMFLMRGLIGNYYCKILLNNLPLQNSVAGSVAIAEQLPIAQAERIEIIWGPSSAIYGADAMSGVINIITRVGEKSAYAQADIRTGNDGYQHANFMVGGKFGRNKNVVRYNVFGNLGRRADTNIKYDPNNYDPLLALTTSAEERENIRKFNPDGFLVFIKDNYGNYQGDVFAPKFGRIPQQSQTLGFSLQYKRLQVNFFDMYRQDFATLGISPVIFGYYDPDTYIGDRQHLASISHDLVFKKWTITTNASYMRYRYNPLSSRSSNYRDSIYSSRAYRFAASDDLFGELLMRYTPAKDLEWTFGASLKASSCMPEGNDLDEPFDIKDYRPFSNNKPTPHPIFGDFGYNPIRVFAGGAFAQFLWTPKRWTVIGGMRMDMTTAYESQGTIPFEIYPRVAVLYKITNNLSVRGSIGSGFKPPSPNLFYTSLAITNPNLQRLGKVNYQQIPNINLSPETLRNIEFGLRGRLGTNIEFDVLYYDNLLENRISGQFIPIDTSIYRNAAAFPGNPVVARAYVNDSVANSLLSGTQVWLRFKNIIRPIKLNLDFGYLRTSGSEILPNGGGELSNVRMMPKSFVQWTLSAQLSEKVFLRLENVHSSDWINRKVSNVSQLNDPLVRTKAYYVMDAILNFNISKQLRTFVKVLNVFDKGYGGIDVTGFDVDLPYNPQLRRNIQLGLNFELK